MATQYPYVWTGANALIGGWAGQQSNSTGLGTYTTYITNSSSIRYVDVPAAAPEPKPEYTATLITVEDEDA